MKSKKIKITIGIIVYFAIVICYYIGKCAANRNGLEYFTWVNALFYFIVWFIPLLAIGIALRCIYIERRKNSRWAKWHWTILGISYAAVTVIIFLLYILCAALFLHTDEKMPDGNYVVTFADGMESNYYFAEPAGFFFRREIVFDDARVADSLSKIYNLNFQTQTADNGSTVFVPEEYPDVEVRICYYGHQEYDYLDTDMPFTLTSAMLEKHKDIFEYYGVELDPLLLDFGEISEDDAASCYGVLITEENAENAACAIAEFIRRTLTEDKRSDGQSYWKGIDGSIFLLSENLETGEIESLRNIPFSLTPDYSWKYDKNVSNDEIREEIMNCFD